MSKTIDILYFYFGAWQITANSISINLQTNTHIYTFVGETSSCNIDLCFIFSLDFCSFLAAFLSFLLFSIDSGEFEAFLLFGSSNISSKPEFCTCKGGPKLNSSRLFVLGDSDKILLEAALLELAFGSRIGIGLPNERNNLPLLLSSAADCRVS